MTSDKIIIKGAREHNLKDINLELPRNKFIVFTGLSGSGKSSLAFDTIYAEGQRRYVESLSAYARQFLEQMQKPDVDSIDGLSPAISIDQKSPPRNPRSTVGTVTEIYDYMRLLFANIGIPHCPKCGRKIERQTVQQIVDQIMEIPEGTKIFLLAPVIRGRKGEYRALFQDIQKDGFIRMRVNNKVYEISEVPTLNKQQKQNIEIVVDRLAIKENSRKRLAESVEIALRFGNGIVEVLPDKAGSKPRIFSEKFACPHCNISLDEITPRIFSFNGPYGACPKCSGLGDKLEFDPDLILPDKSIVLPAGLMEQTITDMRRRLLTTKSENVRYHLYRYMSPIPCEACGGKRLRPESLAVKIGGQSIADVSSLPVKKVSAFLDDLALTEREQLIAKQIIKEIKARLKFLVDVGLDYVALDRQSSTLSGGEAQRTRLATQVGSGLVGVLYILDEPSIGLHQRDNQRLIGTLTRLRDLGNTIIVVEHDEETMRAADHLVDIGPGPGMHGGKIVASGSVAAITKEEKSITGEYLSGKKSIAVPKERKKGSGKYLSIKKASFHNLKNINVAFPLGVFTAVTGVSGSGKSSLINDILYKALAKKFYRSLEKAGSYDRIEGIENIDKVVIINQTPIGRTPRSNPATYTGVFDHIRNLFTLTQEARVRGYQAGRFSFNVKGGRCEACRGDGLVKIEMHFLPDVYVPCDVCKGKRYNRETLEVHYRGKNIFDVLNMTVEEASALFENIPPIKRKLGTLLDVGLSYIKLGQAATTLSGGEAQRVKLATELATRSTGRTLYLLDEPTTGLHFDDIKKLLQVLHRLVDAGNSLIIIEHNLDVIKTADYIIDLGPEGGE
ncbi:MAG: excinuclease ABC subunit UvrA, partial [Candidatus Margulisbacteria bacterium]|nr:excinuclease ABC subunit UvrA [Candidatus Margulisiibacteriota bacterium]